MTKGEQVILIIISLIACAPFTYLLLCFFKAMAHEIIVVLAESNEEKTCSKTERRSLR